MKTKQVEFEGEIVLDDWRVVATYEHPDVFKVNIFQEEGQRDSIGVGIQLTKDQFTDLRNLLKAIDLAEQVII
jgi:hypothetical protein